MPADYQFIDTEKSLDRFLEERPKLIAFDTEFTFERTYRAIPELLQIATPEQIALIDLQSNLPFSRLARLFTSNDVTRLAHSIDHDLDVICMLISGELGPVEDTQLAYAFLNEDRSHGYASVVEKCLGIKLDKSQQRSNWSKRPLSTDQLDYAVQDIVYLPAIWDQLEQLLKEAGRFEWYREEQDRIQFMHPEDPKKIIGKPQALLTMDETVFQFLQKIEAWRCVCAKMADIPKNWIISSKNQVQLARTRHINERRLRRLMSFKMARKHHRRLKGLLQESRNAAAESEELPLPTLAPYVQQLKAQAEECTGKLGINVELLASMKDLLFTVRHYLKHQEFPPWFGEWRTDLIGDAVMATVDEIRQNHAKALAR